MLRVLDLPCSRSARFERTDAGEGGRNTNTAANVSTDTQCRTAIPYQGSLSTARAPGDTSRIEVMAHLTEDRI